jgi:hypothetical protein
MPNDGHNLDSSGRDAARRRDESATRNRHADQKSEKYSHAIAPGHETTKPKRSLDPPISANFATKRRAGRLKKPRRLSNSSMQTMVVISDRRQF